ncbi:MAG: ribosome small subunit-dependent GTPase A [Planctomycetaceae bacterium]|jgi:ribosome biogenesis GTPase|nr:ribosome small subunit-dependent GTPase A [Planctomycetaceae bacterium]
MSKKKSKKTRIEFRKGHQGQRRERGLTEKYANSQDDIDTQNSQRISGKGDLTRHRTVKADLIDPEHRDGMQSIQMEASESTIAGRVIRVHGLESIVELSDGSLLRCAVRRVLKNLSTTQRHVVVTGDSVRVEPHAGNQGWIVRIEPRNSELCRTSKNRRHVIASNIDQIMVVTSAAEPSIKPNLIDRILATAEQNGIEAGICINKCDLIAPEKLQPLIGSYAQMGYRVFMLSAMQGWGIEHLDAWIRGRSSAVIGQSGVGKSSLLNCLIPGLSQRVQAVSLENQKGKHTTTTAEWFRIDAETSIIDTPGIRQFQLWDIVPAELTGLFRDLRPFASHCRYPDCSHHHEDTCAVKDAVADGRLDPRRYESYLQILDAPAFASDDADDTPWHEELE